MPAPRSSNVAPREKKPLGIAIRPAATQEKIDSNVPTLFVGPDEPVKISSIDRAIH